MRFPDQATATTPALATVPPPPRHAPQPLRAPELRAQLAELRTLERCSAALFSATRRRRELPGLGPALAALEAEALHRARRLEELLLDHGWTAPRGDEPSASRLAAAEASLAAAGLVVVALTLAGYRRLEELATRTSDLDALRFAVTSIAEVGGAARQMSREVTRTAVADA